MTKSALTPPGFALVRCSGRAVVYCYNLLFSDHSFHQARISPAEFGEGAVSWYNIT
jgi:hypothetical protein